MPLSALEGGIGHRFASPQLLEEALRHDSAAGENGERSYERLEFLGDAVLSLCVAREVYRLLPLAGEGILTKARAAVINNRNLVRVGERIGVRETLTTDPSVRRNDHGVTRKMVADAVEAIAGAVFLCHWAAASVSPGSSRHIADAALRDPRWNARAGKPMKVGINNLVATLLSEQAFLGRLGAPFERTGYSIAGVTVEKVLVGKAADHSSSPVEANQFVPFDAQVWIRLTRE